MFDDLCDDTHEAHALKIINRACLTIGVCFIAFGTFAVATRLGAKAPPASATYGSEAAPKDAAVFGK